MATKRFGPDKDERFATLDARLKRLESQIGALDRLADEGSLDADLAAVHLRNSLKANQFNAAIEVIGNKVLDYVEGVCDQVGEASTRAVDCSCVQVRPPPKDNMPNAQGCLAPSGEADVLEQLEAKRQRRRERERRARKMRESHEWREAAALSRSLNLDSGGSRILNWSGGLRNEGSGEMGAGSRRSGGRRGSSSRRGSGAGSGGGSSSGRIQVQSPTRSIAQEGSRQAQMLSYDRRSQSFQQFSSGSKKSGSQVSGEFGNTSAISWQSPVASRR